MAQSYEIIRLSGSVDGQAIDVSATAGTAAVTIHTAGSATTDLITIYATNNDAEGETRTLNLYWGGTAASDVITLPVPCKAGPVLATWQLPLTNAKVVRAWSDEAPDCDIHGSVIRVTTT
jgi:hypothetical protein